MASDEVSLKRHIEHAQIPVLHQDDQVKLAAASGIADNKQNNQLAEADQNLTLDTFRRLRHQFGSNIKSFGDTALKNGSDADVASGSATKGNKTTDVPGSKGAISMVLAEKLVPISSFLGSTLGTSTGMTQTPSGSLNELPNMLGHLMDRTNPQLRSQLEVGFMQHKANKLSEMPKSLNASIEQLAHSLKSQIGTPNRFVSDQYYGALKTINQLSKLKETLFGLVQKFGENIIDTKFPGVADFLKSALKSASKLPNITSKFGVGTVMPGALKQVNMLSTTINGFAKNPIGAAGQYFKMESMTSKIHVIQDPSSLLQKQFPPQLTSWTSKLGNMSGLGRGGNMGFNFGQKLAELQPNVLNNITKSFASHQAILGPILNRATHDVSSHNYATTPSVLKDGTSYQTNTAGEKILENPRTNVVQANTYPPDEKPINYFTQNKLEKGASETASTASSASTNSPPPALSLGSSSPIKLFGD